MKFSQVAIYAALFLAGSEAAPVVEERGQTPKLQFVGFPSSAKCGGGAHQAAARVFSESHLEDTAESAARLNIKAPNLGVGSQTYPHTFQNRGNPPEIGNFKAQCTGDKQEYPLFTDKIFNGGDSSDRTRAENPQADRIVIQIQPETKKGSNTYPVLFCGLMTHDGAPGNDFVECSGW
ncbi:hypothetical protein G7Y89_g2852 [Cudoniella acicularis]|uniref:ribonuclease T1 n=1 Tax=Cudoniella acicularis TaxID=354080 RepID=A0A8H4W5R5_9HELO|nr:hypothetical protein G7Y89_g2852 [Cudoniella acicularis]